MTENFYRYQRLVDLNFMSKLHLHPEIVAVSEGMLNVWVFNRRISLKAGEGLYLPGFISHRFETERSSVCHIWEYSNDLLPRILGDYTAKFCFPVEQILLCDSFSDRENPFMNKAAVCFVASYASSDKAQTYKNCFDEPIAKAAEFIEQNWNRHITLKETAEWCGLSYSYFCKLFRKTTGFSFIKVLNMIRAEHSAILLLNTSMSITYIASESGFDSIRNYNKVFMSLYGISPSEYRKTKNRQDARRLISDSGD